VVTRLVDQVAPLVQAGMVLVTGVVAIRGLSAWRQQMIGKRKAELAEQVLVGFYAARDTLKWARVPAFGSEEGASRKPVENEDEQVRIMRNVYYIPIERLLKENAGILRTCGHSATPSSAGVGFLLASSFGTAQG